MGRTVAVVLPAMVVSAVAVMFVVALLQLRIDLPPEGPACDYELEDQSGGTPGGVERIEWGLTPDRRCEVPDGDPSAGPLAGELVTGTSDDLEIGVFRFLAGVVAGVVGGGVALVVLTRRRTSVQVSGVESPT